MPIPVLRAGKAVYDKLSDEEENNMAEPFYKKAGWQEPFAQAGGVTAHVIPTGLAYKQGWLQKDNPRGENNMAQEQMVGGSPPGAEDEFGGYEEMKDPFKYNQEMGDDARRPREETNEKRARWVAALLGIGTVAAAILLRNPSIMARVSGAGKNASTFVRGLAGSPIVKQAVETAKKVTGVAGNVAQSGMQKAAGYGRQAYQGAQRMNPFR